MAYTWWRKKREKADVVEIYYYVPASPTSLDMKVELLNSYGVNVENCGIKLLENKEESKDINDKNNELYKDFYDSAIDMIAKELNIQNMI